MMGMLLARVTGRKARASHGSIWQAVRVYIHGRQARLFERERRATLLAVPQALLPGTRIIDRRADGSELVIDIPPGLQGKDAPGNSRAPDQLFQVLPIAHEGRSVTNHGSATARVELATK